MGAVGWSHGGERGAVGGLGGFQEWGVPALTCLSLRQTVEHGFPSQPSALAYDPVLRVMAIGTKAGAVKLYPFPPLRAGGKDPPTHPHPGRPHPGGCRQTWPCCCQPIAAPHPPTLPASVRPSVQLGCSWAGKGGPEETPALPKMQGGSNGVRLSQAGGFFPLSPPLLRGGSWPPSGGGQHGGCRINPTRGQRGLRPAQHQGWGGPGVGLGGGRRHDDAGARPGFVAGAACRETSEGCWRAARAGCGPRSGGPAPQECGGRCVRGERKGGDGTGQRGRLRPDRGWGQGLGLGRGLPCSSSPPQPAARCLPSTKMAFFYFFFFFFSASASPAATSPAALLGRPAVGCWLRPPLDQTPPGGRGAAVVGGLRCPVHPPRGCFWGGTRLGAGSGAAWSCPRHCSRWPSGPAPAATQKMLLEVQGAGRGGSRSWPDWCYWLVGGTHGCSPARLGGSGCRQPSIEGLPQPGGSPGAAGGPWARTPITVSRCHRCSLAVFWPVEPLGGESPQEEQGWVASPIPAVPGPPYMLPLECHVLWPPQSLCSSSLALLARLCPALPDSSCLSVWAEPPGQFSAPRASGGQPEARTTGVGGQKTPARGVPNRSSVVHR